jgi:hypothetical protein
MNRDVLNKRINIPALKPLLFQLVIQFSGILSGNERDLQQKREIGRNTSTEDKEGKKREFVTRPN